VTAVWLRWRALFSVLAQVLWHYRLTVVTVLAAMYGIISAVTEPPMWANIFIGAIGLLTATAEIVTLRTRARSIVFQARTNDDYHDVTYAERDRGHAVRAGTDVGQFYLSESDLMRGRDIPAVVDDKPFSLPDRFAPWSIGFLLRRIRSATLHNGSVVGLSSDLPTDSTDLRDVHLRKCDYFNFVGTNILAAYDLREAGSFSTKQDGRSLFLDDRSAQPIRFARSQLANVMGVSTLAFTIDGFVVLVVQSTGSLNSPGLVAPSGSGALEQQDLPSDPDSNDSLQQIVTRGASRELSEECQLQDSEILTTEVLGYGR